MGVTCEDLRLHQWEEEGGLVITVEDPSSKPTTWVAVLARKHVFLGGILETHFDLEVTRGTITWIESVPGETPGSYGLRVSVKYGETLDHNGEWQPNGFSGIAWSAYVPKEFDSLRKERVNGQERIVHVGGLIGVRQIFIPRTN